MGRGPWDGLRLSASSVLLAELLGKAVASCRCQKIAFFPAYLLCITALSHAHSQVILCACAGTRNGSEYFRVSLLCGCDHKTRPKKNAIIALPSVGVLRRKSICFYAL